MNDKNKTRLIFILLGFITGLFVTAVAGGVLYMSMAKGQTLDRYQAKVAQPVSVNDNRQGTSPVGKDGVSVFAASSLDRIFQDGKTLVKPSFTDQAVISAARLEYESFQVVVAAGNTTLENVYLSLSPLTHADGTTRINENDFTWRVVNYVPTKKPYYPVKYVGPWPDPLMPPKPTTVAAKSTQPFWLTVFVDEKTPAGTYTGKVMVKDSQTLLSEIPVELTVYDFDIPKASSFKTAFDFYGHESYKRYPRGEEEDEEAYEFRLEDINDRFIISMLQYRVNPVLNVDPTKDEELAKVDKYLRYGLNNFSIGKRGGTLNNNWPTTDEEIDALAVEYLTYGEILKLNRMLPLTYIYTWDEGKIGDPRVSKVAGMIKTAYPALKNMVCYHGFWDPEEHPGWGDDIDIWTFQISQFSKSKIQRMRKLGMEVWMYVSGPSGDGTPNLGMDFDSTDYRIIPWMSWKYDLTGFLYWCVNWWPFVDPFESAKNTKWEQNGNGLLFYPGPDGPIASQRIEIFRDGMEDYEYFVILNDLIKYGQKKNLKEQHPQLFQRASDLLMIDDSLVESHQSFTKDGDALKNRRNQMAQSIVELRALFKGVSTK